MRDAHQTRAAIFEFAVRFRGDRDDRAAIRIEVRIFAAVRFHPQVCGVFVLHFELGEHRLRPHDHAIFARDGIATGDAIPEAILHEILGNSHGPVAVTRRLFECDFLVIRVGRIVAKLHAQAVGAVRIRDSPFDCHADHQRLPGGDRQIAVLRFDEVNLRARCDRGSRRKRIPRAMEQRQEHARFEDQEPDRQHDDQRADRAAEPEQPLRFARAVEVSFFHLLGGLRADDGPHAFGEIFVLQVHPVHDAVFRVGNGVFDLFCRIKWIDRTTPGADDEVVTGSRQTAEQPDDANLTNPRREIEPAIHRDHDGEVSERDCRHGEDAAKQIVRANSPRRNRELPIDLGVLFCSQ